MLVITIEDANEIIILFSVICEIEINIITGIAFEFQRKREKVTADSPCRLIHCSGPGFGIAVDQFIFAVCNKSRHGIAGVNRERAMKHVAFHVKIIFIRVVSRYR